MTRDPNPPPDTAPELRLMHDRLMRAQAIANLGSWELDLATRTMWASVEAFQIYGVEAPLTQELSLGIVQSMVTEGHRAKLDQALSDLIEHDKEYDVEFEICRRRDGAVRTIHSRARLVRHGDGTPALVYGTIHDITEIGAKDRALMATLRTSEERARMAFEQAADAIFLGDSEGKFLSVNERALDLTGFSREELLRGTLHMLFNKNVIAAKPFRFDLVEQGGLVTFERTLTRKDGQQCPVEMRTRKLPDGTLQCIVRDLSERRRLEEQLQLRQRMDSIGALTAGVAHQFNNVLAGIMGYTFLLTEAPSTLDAVQSECVQNILHATQRAADLVVSLRNLSHPEPVEPASLDLFEVAAEIISVLRATTDRIIGKELRFPPGQCIVLGSAPALYQALMNIGVNSVQAIEQKGPSAEDRITIDGDICEILPEHALGLAPGPYAHLTVSDTGVGMSDEVRRHAFEPLFSTRNTDDHRSHGLGLAMVYNIVVRQHGGGIDIDTAPGHGCRFHVYLPLSHEQPQSSPSLAPDSVRLAPMIPSLAPSAPRGNERILVVEDEPQLARLTRTILERLGYQVLSAADGLEAVETFERERDTIDLVLLDRTLPGLRGEQLFERLRAMRPNLRVLVTSGDASLSMDAFSGACGTLPKPYPPAALAAAIRDALDAAEPTLG